MSLTLYPKVFHFTSIFAAIALWAAAISNAEASMQFDPYGTNRILVACQGSEANVISGLTSKLDWTEFKSRDLVLLMQKNDALYILSEKEKPTKLMSVSVRQIQTTATCESETSYILIGKDGGLKRRWQITLSLEDLYQTIDAMPMRRYEMRTRGGN